MVVPPQSTQVRRWTANRVKKTSVLDRIMISGWLKQILIQSLNYGPDSQAIFWDLEHICCTWGAPVGKFFGFSLGTSRFALCTVEPTVYIHAVCTQDLSRIRIFLRFVYKEAENERKVFVNQHTHTHKYIRVLYVFERDFLCGSRNAFLDETKQIYVHSVRIRTTGKAQSMKMFANVC